MSAYDNVVVGKLKKKKNKRNQELLQVTQDEISAGGSTEQANELSGKGKEAHYDDHLTPAERRYIEQREQLDIHRLTKIANNSHRDRIQDFNHYLANMSEHYDIPKVGPG